MENNEQHINELLKQKFEDFAPQPPARVWEGIAAALDKEVVPVWYKTLWGKVAAAVLIIALIFAGYWLFNKGNNQQTSVAISETVKTHTPEANVNNPVNSNSKAADKPSETQQTKPVTDNNPDNSNSSSAKEAATAYVNTTSRPNNNKSGNPVKQKQKVSVATGNYSVDNTVTEYNKSNIELLNTLTIDFNSLMPPLYVSSNNPVNNPAKQKPESSDKRKMGRWALGFYFAPEFIAANYDSLTIQNGYALNVEPVYYFNRHWFIRPGLGVQYSRDKGFVQADYISWDKLGTYNDVIDVTFDTINGNVTPIYHTQKVEVFDSVRHITLSEETNRYLYLNTSLIFGYHNHKRKLGWSVYAGGGVNFILYHKQELPVDHDVTYISLDYNLTKRQSPQYHVKFGIGLDYIIGKKWQVTVEPEYRYFVNGINGGDNYNNPLSGMGLRFGFVYMLK